MAQTPKVNSLPGSAPMSIGAWPDGIASLKSGWRMQVGDQPAFAAPDYDDRAWPAVSLSDPSQAQAGPRWYSPLAWARLAKSTRSISTASRSAFSAAGIRVPKQSCKVPRHLTTAELAFDVLDRGPLKHEWMAGRGPGTRAGEFRVTYRDNKAGGVPGIACDADFADRR